MYHHVANVAGGGPYGRALTVSPQEFAVQLRTMQGRGCAMVRLSRLVDDVSGGRNRACEIALTFDDGYADAMTEAAPLLRSAGAAGTFFITTGLIGTAGHLTRAQIIALGQEGMEIDAHTVTHRDLTKMPAAAAAAEAEDSRTALLALVG